MKFIIAALSLLLSTSAFSQDIFGQWKTIDDETGEAKSIVEIYKKGDKAYGKIVKLFRKPTEEQDPYCDKCEDDRKDKRIIGMEIIRDMEQDDEEWEDGTILDPKKGEIYDCKIWVDEDDSDLLQVRGYVWMFYRTQTWERGEIVSLSLYQSSYPLVDIG